MPKWNNSGTAILSCLTVNPYARNERSAPIKKPSSRSSIFDD
jgi:hypothetical protein